MLGGVWAVRMPLDIVRCRWKGAGCLTHTGPPDLATEYCLARVPFEHVVDPGIAA